MVDSFIWGKGGPKKKKILTPEESDNRARGLNMLLARLRYGITRAQIKNAIKKIRAMLRKVPPKS